MRLPALCSVLVALALLTPAQAAGPQITDPANDANFANGQGFVNGFNNNATPVGTQGYADVLSVQWTTLRTTKVVKRKKVTTVVGFQVQTKLSAPPTPPQGTTIVYRMLGKTPLCGFFGVAYYTTPLSDPETPQSAIRDNCVNGTTRLTKIAPPYINGSTITWTVPLAAIPKDTKVGVGTLLTEVWFTVNEIEDFQGQKVPDQVPVYGGATGLGLGVVDDSYPGDAAYKIGS